MRIHSRKTQQNIENSKLSRNVDQCNPQGRFLVVVFITYFSVDPILCASAAAKAAELALQNDSSCSLSVSYSNHFSYESSNET